MNASGKEGAQLSLEDEGKLLEAKERKRWGTQVKYKMWCHILISSLTIVSGIV